jgi:hypothetical protein
MVFSLTGVIGGIIFPVLSFVWAFYRADCESICYLWLLTALSNTIYLTGNWLHKILLTLLVQVKSPKFTIIQAASKLPSFVMQNCPTRMLYLRQDIYCFCWSLCLEPKELKSLGIAEQNHPTAQHLN